MRYQVVAVEISDQGMALTVVHEAGIGSSDTLIGMVATYTVPLDTFVPETTDVLDALHDFAGLVIEDYNNSQKSPQVAEARPDEDAADMILGG